MPTDPANLEFTADEMRRMGYATIERLVDHVLSLEALAAGESTRSVAAAEGLSNVAVHLIGRRLTGVKRSYHADDPPIAACGKSR